jgi:hypothetical protein
MKPKFGEIHSPQVFLIEGKYAVAGIWNGKGLYAEFLEKPQPESEPMRWKVEEPLDGRDLVVTDLRIEYIASQIKPLIRPLGELADLLKSYELYKLGDEVERMSSRLTGWQDTCYQLGEDLPPLQISVDEE